MKIKSFVVNVMDINLTQKTTITNVISVVVKPSVIVKICKYKRFHEGHHFIPMAIKVCIAFKHNMDNFIKECVHLFHNRQLRSFIFVFLHSIF